MRRGYILISAIVVLPVFLAGCKYRAKRVQPGLLLLETRLERTYSGKTEVVSRVRFVAQPEAATAVFLPCGDKLGIGISFVPSTDAEGCISLSRAVYTARFFAEDILGDFARWPSKQANATGGRTTTFRGKIGEDIRYARGQISRNNFSVDFRVIVNCEKRVDPVRWKDGLLVVNGEALELLNVAIPELMSAGVELNIERGTKGE
jgi:hypothetical protein